MLDAKHSSCSIALEANNRELFFLFCRFLLSIALTIVVTSNVRNRRVFNRISNSYVVMDAYRTTSGMILNISLTKNGKSSIFFLWFIVAQIIRLRAKISLMQMAKVFVEIQIVSQLRPIKKETTSTNCASRTRIDKILPFS